MNLTIFADTGSLARAAAAEAASTIVKAIDTKGSARIIAATGTSQFDFLDQLTSTPTIDWKRVEVFHLDEYIGIPATHPASFQKYLLERLISKTAVIHYHLLDGEKNPEEVIAEATREIRKAPIDVAFVGIGENGHLAFNEPPADFTTEASFIVVTLDEVSRRQQFTEGWFASLKEVPERAITMTVSEILRAQRIICLAQGKRKATAVARCFEGAIDPLAPASILQSHDDTFVYLDLESASLLSQNSPRI
jgi:glucosamine-6-phosphate deaminase